MKRALIGVGGIVLLTLVAVSVLRLQGSRDVARSSTGAQPAPTGGAPGSDHGADQGVVLVEPPARHLVYPEVTAVVKALGPDVAQLLSFVSQRIRYEPYEGALRGPRGTLLAASGNAIDRALLLRDLIQTAKPDVELRFALGTLTAGQAVETLSRTRLPPDGAAGPATHDAPPPADDSDGQMLEQWRRAGDTVRRDADELRQLLEAAGVQATVPAFDHQRAVDDTRRHVWLQLRDDQSWVDLDPSAGGGIGKRLCDAEVTASDLPGELFHTLRVEVRAEQRQGRATVERELLTGHWRISDLVGSSMVFTHAEPAGLEPPARPPVTAGRRAYTPTLILDGEELFGEPFILPEPPADAGGALPGVDGLARGIGGLLGGGSGQQRPADAGTAAPDDVVSLSLDFVLVAPDGTSRRTRRTIFDRRVTGTDAPSVDSPLAPLTVSYEEYAPLITAWSIAIWTGERALARSLNPAIRLALEPETPEEMREQFALFHRTYFGLRRVLYASATKTPRSPLHVRAPDLSLLSWRVGSRGSEAGALLIDVLQSQARPVPDDASKASAPELERIWAQATLHAERTLILGSITDYVNRDGADQAFIDVAGVFAQAKAQNVPIRVLKGGDAELEQIRAPADVRARLRGHLSDKRVVVVPDRPVTLQGREVLGWWLFDPENGSYLDEMDTGGHQSSGEHTAVTGQGRAKTAAARAGFWPKVRRGINCLARVAAALLQLGEAVVDVREGDIPSIIENLDEAEGAAGRILRGCSSGGLPPPTSTGPKGGKWKPPRWPRPRNDSRPGDPRLPKRPPWRGAPRGR